MQFVLYKCVTSISLLCNSTSFTSFDLVPVIGLLCIVVVAAPAESKRLRVTKNVGWRFPQTESIPISALLDEN